jgi:hypothetical protein
MCLRLARNKIKSDTVDDANVRHLTGATYFAAYTSSDQNSYHRYTKGEHQPTDVYFNRITNHETSVLSRK